MGIEVIVANTAEAFSDVLGSIKSGRERRKRINHEDNLSIRALLWGADDRVLILPKLPSPALLRHLSDIGRYRRLIVLSPNLRRSNLCEDVLEDEDVMKELKSHIKGQKAVRISAYSVTEQFSRLVNRLCDDGIDLASDSMVASQTVWASRYLDSKIGFRCEAQALAENVTGLTLPSGFVCADEAAALGAAEWFFDHGREFVVKAERGESGWGLVRSGRIRIGEKSRALKRVAKALHRDTVYSTGALLVEEWLTVTKDRFLISPSVEVFVSDETSSVLYVCGQLITKDGGFDGVIIGPECPSRWCRRAITRIAGAVGARFKELGVRGHFDIDFVVSQDGALYAVESNVRRTGGTHVFGLKKRLGPLFSSYWFLAEDNYIYGKKRHRDEAVFERLSQQLFTREKREGVVVTLLAPQSPSIGYVIIADSYAKMLRLRKRMRKTLA